MQLMELAIMNGTFRDALPAQNLQGASITVVNTPRKFINIHVLLLNVPSCQPSKFITMMT